MSAQRYAGGGNAEEMWSTPSRDILFGKRYVAGMFQKRLTNAWIECAACNGEVRADHRYCPWCAKPLADHVTERVERVASG